MSEISKMSREELETTAADLGIEFRANITDAKLAERIKTHLGEPTPALTDGPDMTKKGEVKKYEISIATDANDKQPVPVTVNGHNYIIKRGQRVTVPAPVVEVLDHAVKHVYDPETMEKQEIHAYPYQIHREVAA